MRSLQCSCLTFCLLASTTLFAQTSVTRPTESNRPIESEAWQFERLTLKNGRTMVGLLQATDGMQLEFAEIYRPPGAPMHAVVRIVEARQIAKLERLPEEQRRVLADRFHQFRRRATVEAASLESVALTPEPSAGSLRWHYEGRWFDLVSTADEESTRRCVVRIEQMFRAFQQLLTPQVQGHCGLRIELYGSLENYHAALRQMGLDLQSLAFFSSPQKLIVAGVELSDYSDQLASIRSEHAKLIEAAEVRGKEFRQQLADLSRTLEQRGFTRQQLETEMSLRKAAWNREHDALLRRISEANRRNDSRFLELTQRMFRRLDHEAFHAYLQLYVAADRPGAIDRWLNEGLAQVFEGGQIDGDTLRIDAPDGQRLARLQRDLTGAKPLTMEELLAADDEAFLATHAAEASGQYYLYAWGLAYYLTFVQNRLDDATLHDFLAAPNATRQQRFERLVACPLEEFEVRWREAMLRLK